MLIPASRSLRRLVMTPALGPSSRAWGGFCIADRCSEDEILSSVDAAGTAARGLHDFYAGVSVSLAEMLISPEFLFRFKTMEPDPASPGHERMDGFSKASELSFFLWKHDS